MGLNKQKQVGTKVPAIRFDGFCDEWVGTKLGDVVDIVGGYAFKSSNYKDEGVPIVRISNLDGNNVNMFDNVIYYDEIDIDDRYMVDNGDLLIAMSGATAGGLGVYYGDDVAYLNQRVGKFEPYAELLSNLFLYSLVATFGFKSGLDALLVAGAQPNISSKNISSIHLNVPQLSEQTLIGDFFKTIDDLISAEKEQLENYEQYKEAMLQKMFPKKGEVVPEVRFDGFTDEWSETKLGDVLDYEQPTKYLVDSDEYSDSFETPVLTAGKTFLLGYTDDINGIYDKGNVILFDDFTTAFHHIEFPFKVKSSATKFLTTTSDDYSLRFIYESMKGIQYPTDSHKRYWISEYTSLSRMVPSISEQILIGDFFKTIDDVIRVKSNRVDELSQMKESFLQKMFV